jgi:hypothetical protein
MILSSHYVIKDMMHTVERGDASEIRRACEKYCNRYKNDKAFVSVCNILMESEELEEKEQEEIMMKLQDLLSVRKVDSSGGTGLWYTDRRKLNR